MHLVDSIQSESVLQRIQKIMLRSDTDRNAASVRIVLALGVFIYLLLKHNLQDGYSVTFLILTYVSMIYLIYSVLLWLSNVFWPGEILTRRVISILADTAVVTYAMIAGGETTSVFFGGYLMVSIANGLRYGRKYLFLTNLFSVLGFSLVLGYTPYWHFQITLGIGLMFWLILLPGYVSVLLKRLENALHKANFANKAKTDFLSNMSHELRTPLNIIISYSDLLEEDAVEDGNRQLADDAGKIQQSANHLLSLINGILELSRIESEQSHHNSECFDIRLLFENIQAGLQGRFGENGNMFSISYNLEQYEIYSDQLKLKQVMLPVLDNANKFTSKGEIHVDVFSAGSYANPLLCIHVSDNGIGIPANQLSTIFDPFTQVDSTITRKYEGVGLGLTIAKRFVEILDGTINVRSVEFQGTEVMISIPLYSAVSANESDSQKSKPYLRQALG